MRVFSGPTAYHDALAAGVEAAKQQERDAVALRKAQASGELVPPTKSYDISGANALDTYHAMLADAQAAQAAEPKAPPVPKGGGNEAPDFATALASGALDMPDWSPPASGAEEITERYEAFLKAQEQKEAGQ